MTEIIKYSPLTRNSPKKNAFSNSPDLLQITGYSLFFEFLFSQGFVVLPTIRHLPLQIVSTLATLVVSLLLAQKSCELSSSDPTDPLTKVSAALKNRG